MTLWDDSQAWTFSEQPEFLIAVARNVLTAEDPVCCIQHTKDGRWYFFGSPARFPASQTRLVEAKLGDVVTLHPYVIEFSHLPTGAQVERYPSESPWVRSILKDD